MLPSRAHGEMDGRREMTEKTTLLQERETLPELKHSRGRSSRGPHSFVSWFMGVNVCDIGNVWANLVN